MEEPLFVINSRYSRCYSGSLLSIPRSVYGQERHFRPFLPKRSKGVKLTELKLRKELTNSETGITTVC